MSPELECDSSATELLSMTRTTGPGAGLGGLWLDTAFPCTTCSSCFCSLPVFQVIIISLCGKRRKFKTVLTNEGNISSKEFLKLKQQHFQFQNSIALPEKIQRLLGQCSVYWAFYSALQTTGISVIKVRINAFKFDLDLELNNLISHIPLKHQGCNSPYTNTVDVGLQLFLNYKLCDPSDYFCWIPVASIFTLRAFNHKHFSSAAPLTIKHHSKTGRGRH